MNFKDFYWEVTFDPDTQKIASLSGKIGDTKSRGMYVTIIQKNEIITDLTGLSMRLYFKKPDDTRGIVTAVIDGNRFRIDFPNQLFAVPGIVNAELELCGSDGEIIADETFRILVHERIGGDEIISEDERGVLDRAFELAEDIVPRLELLDVELLENCQERLITVETDIANLEETKADLQTTLAQILEKMIAAPATEAKQDSLATLVGAIEDKLDGVIDGTTPATTQVTGSTMEIYKATVDERPAANSVPVGACFMAVNTGEIWQSNGTDWVVM